MDKERNDEEILEATTMGRRSMLKRVLIGGAVAYAAPVVATFSLDAAAAQPNPSDIEGSFRGGNQTLPDWGDRWHGGNLDFGDKWHGGNQDFGGDWNWSDWSNHDWHRGGNQTGQPFRGPNQNWPFRRYESRFFDRFMNFFIRR